MSQNDLDIASKRGFARKLWALLWPFFWSEQRLMARVLLAVIVVLTLSGVALDVAFNYWYKDFYNSLQHQDEPEFWYQLRKFTFLAIAYILVAVYNLYLKQMLHIRWRRWMTERL